MSKALMRKPGYSLKIGERRHQSLVECLSISGRKLVILYVAQPSAEGGVTTL